MTINAAEGGVATSALRLRFLYFVYFVAVGAYYPFLVPYLRGLGLGGNEIGTAQMAGAVASVPAALLWGALADRLRAPARALVLATRGAFVASILLLLVRTPNAIILVLFGHGLVAPVINPLVDTVTVEAIREMRDTSYARIRLFGSLGFIVSAQGLGLLLAARADRAGDIAFPVTYAAALAATAIVATTLPRAPASALPKPRLVEMAALLADRRLVLLLAAGAVHAATTASYQLYGLLVRDQGLSPAVTGAGMAFGVGAEVLVLFAFPALQRRFSTGTLLALSFAASSLRWLVLAQSHGAVLLVVIQAFHGLTYGLYWAAAVEVLGHLVPPRLRATGQTLYSAVTFSIGGAVGYRLAGFAYERFGSAGPVYAWAALVELVALALALRLRGRTA